MTRQFIAALLSLSIGLTAMTTAPARADDDVAKILAGIAVIGILSQVLKDDDKGRVVTRSNQGTWNGNKHGTVKKRPRHVVKKAPRRCLRQQWTHRGNRDVYGARCMKQNAGHALPRNCLRRIETRNGPRAFYAPNCLRREGWRA